MGNRPLGWATPMFAETRYNILWLLHLRVSQQILGNQTKWRTWLLLSIAFFHKIFFVTAMRTRTPSSTSYKKLQFLYIFIWNLPKIQKPLSQQGQTGRVRVGMRMRRDTQKRWAKDKCKHKYRGKHKYKEKHKVEDKQKHKGKNKTKDKDKHKDRDKDDGW